MRRLLLSTTFACLPGLGWADDTALILGIERYEQLPRVARADDGLAAQDGLEALGFTVRARANARADAARDLAGAFAQDAREAERLVVALSGHFVTDGARTWLLTAEASEPDLFSVDQMGLSLESVLAVLAARPGQAVLVLGVADQGALDLDESGLRPGIGEMDIPQGVTVVRSSTSVAARFLEADLTEPEADLGSELLLNPSLFTSGYRPMNWVLMPGAVEVETVTTDPTPSDTDLNAEAAAWDAAVAADTAEAYRAYIRDYPRGRFVETAEENIAAILAEPNRAARLAEEALGLSRTDRRSIQSDLTILGYDTRGVDGIFGPGSRRAITNWQQSNGYPQTSYVTQAQINRLNAQAERRRAEIAAQEERERAEAEQLDRDYWEETGAKGDEPGYRAYLARYPEGVFADVARARLQAIEDARARAAEVEDRASWGIAAAEDSIASYQEYLAAYPNGVFAQEARDRIAAMQGPQITDAQIAAARAQEETLRLSGVRAQLLELRLRDLGFNPGPLDGVIDERTRAAIRAFQEATGVTPTGYVDQASLVTLMSGTSGR